MNTERQPAGQQGAADGPQVEVMEVHWVLCPGELDPEGDGGAEGWAVARSDRPAVCVCASQLIRPINALDELCRLMKSSVHPKPGAAGSLGAGLIPISSELCYRLGACQIAMCGTGMQR